MDAMAFKNSAGLLLAKVEGDEDAETFEEWSADDEESENFETYAEIGYSEQIGNVISLLSISIFAQGIMAGLVMGLILWRRFQ